MNEGPRPTWPHLFNGPLRALSTTVPPEDRSTYGSGLPNGALRPRVRCRTVTSSPHAFGHGSRIHLVCKFLAKTPKQATHEGSLKCRSIINPIRAPQSPTHNSASVISRIIVGNFLEGENRFISPCRTFAAAEVAGVVQFCVPQPVMQ